MHDTQLIERRLPISALGKESVRERRIMTSLFPPFFLHVWWARRPLVASRAAAFASPLPGDADWEKSLNTVETRGDPVAASRRIDQAKRNKENLGPNLYGYKRAFTYQPSVEHEDWVERPIKCESETISVLDPVAGAGTLLFETGRLGFRAMGNDLNPVAALLLQATVNWPTQFGSKVTEQFVRLANQFLSRAGPKYENQTSTEADGTRIDGYLWARAIPCPYCEGLLPPSPIWRLAWNFGPRGILCSRAPNRWSARVFPWESRRWARYWTEQDERRVKEPLEGT